MAYKPAFINYQTNIRQYKPDVIIIMHTINDLLNNADFSYFGIRDFRSDYGHFSGPVSYTVKQGYYYNKLMDLFKRYWYYKPKESVYQKYLKARKPLNRI